MLHTIPNITFNHLTYIIPDTKVAFSDLSFTLPMKKIGIVGDNGIGKSTLLRLMTGESLPQNGSVKIFGEYSYYRQQHIIPFDKNVAEVLGIQEKLSALSRILAGSTNIANYDILQDDWDIENQAIQQLSAFQLQEISLNSLFSELSGGQQSRLLLAKVWLEHSNFILLDEPTNSLDSFSREQLYRNIVASERGIIIASHDRQLLNHMEQIIEITEKGINFYGGNYDFYLEQKAIQAQALLQQLEDAEKKLQRVEKSSQLSLERHDQKRSRGRKAFLDGKIDKMGAGSKRGRSEKTQSRLTILDERMNQQAKDNLASIKDKMEIKFEMKADLSATKVPAGKLVLTMENVFYQYPNTDKPIIQNFNLSILGPQRISLSGKNGAGKTTLVKLMMNDLQPCNGKIYLGIDQINYLDQTVSILNPKETVLENFQRLQPDMPLTEVYRALAHFMFRNKQAEKLISHLSGGERIRAGLACTLLSKKPPQMLILDEPTNHLDITSMECIEEALRKYEGCLLVISHDQRFLENIQIDREIML